MNQTQTATVCKRGYAHRLFMGNVGEIHCG